MAWWGWIAVGAILLAAEISFVDAQFYLVFLGVSALLVGATTVLGLSVAIWQQWLLFAFFAVGALVVFRRRAYGWLHEHRADGEIPEGVEGEVASAIDVIPPGGSGAVHLRGTRWSGENTGESTIEAGSRCRVVRAEGLVLHVTSES